MNKIITLIFTILLGLQAFSQEKMLTQTLPYDLESVPREHYVDFTHLKLEVNFIPEEGRVNGKVTHTFTPKRNNIDTLFLDGPAISIKSVKHGKDELQFKTYENGHTILFNQPLSWDKEEIIEIEYFATPKKGLYFIGWNDKTNRSRKQIWSQGQGIDNRYWIPMYDNMNDKVVSEMIITMKKPYAVLSNGVQQSVKDNKDGTQTWHYALSKPHAPYLIMLGIGEYKVGKMLSKNGVKLNLWYYPDHEDRFETTYRYSAEMMDFFEQEIGVPYPWEEYAQIPVQNFLYGAMENTSATVFGDFFCIDKRGYLDRTYVGVNAHELAHQWFGDLVTARSSTHHWLQESFATHYNWLFERVAFGDDYFDMARRGANNASLKASEKDLFPLAHSLAGSTRHYPKGAFVIEMMKYVVGRDAYNRSVKHYLERHGFGNVNSQDLLVAFHETLGVSLDWFWDQWVSNGGEPAYEVKAEISKDQQLLTFDVQQVHDTSGVVNLFKMPIVFEAYYTDGSKEAQQVRIEKQSHKVEIPLKKGKKLAYYLFDPNNQVLKSVRFEKPFEVIAEQALNAPYMLDRYDAVLALRDFELKEKSKTLFNIYAKEKSHYVKAEILSQLSGEEVKKTKKIFTQAFEDTDVKMRKAALAAFDKIPEAFKTSVEKLLTDSSYQLIDDALTKLSNSFPDELSNYLEITKNEYGINGLSLRFTWLELSLKAGNSAVLRELVDYASNSFEFNVRRNAFALLIKLKLINNEILENAFDAAFDNNSRLAGGGIGLLNHFYKTQPDITLQLDARYAKGQWNPTQNKVWERIRAK